MYVCILRHVDISPLIMGRETPYPHDYHNEESMEKHGVLPVLPPSHRLHLFLPLTCFNVRFHERSFQALKENTRNTLDRFKTIKGEDEGE